MNQKIYLNGMPVDVVKLAEYRTDPTYLVFPTPGVANSFTALTVEDIERDENLRAYVVNQGLPMPKKREE